MVRTNLSKGLGFSQEDRDENIKRVGIRLPAFDPPRGRGDGFGDFPLPGGPGLITARKIGNFVEVYVSCPVEICAQRDIKGLYQKAMAGEIKGFTGVDDPYEPPENPEVICRTDKESVEICVEKVLKKLEELGYIS